MYVEPPGEVAEVFVEAAIQRMMPLRLAEVPLSDQPGGVAGALEHVGQSPLVRRESDLGVPARGVELVSEAGLVPAGVEAGPRRAADGRGHVPVGQPDAATREGVEVRRSNRPGTERAEVAVAQVVRQDDHDVGRRRGRVRLVRRRTAGHRERSQHGEGEDRHGRPHCSLGRHAAGAPRAAPRNDISPGPEHRFPPWSPRLPGQPPPSAPLRPHPLPAGAAGSGRPAGRRSCLRGRSP